MPGLVGIISKHPRPELEEDLGRMVAAMMHEPFYSSGTFVDQSLGIYAGWVAQQGSYCDCQPIVKADGQAVLLFAGESLQASPSSDPRAQRSAAANAAGLIDLYDGCAKSFAARLNGWFAGLLADFGKREAVLFNDRFGMHRVHVFEGRQELLFASEAKSLLTVRPRLRRFDPASLAEYLRYNCVLRGKTLFQGVTTLPPASAWRFAGGALSGKEAYFDPSSWEEQEALPDGEFYPRFAATLSEVIPRYAASRERVAVSLTAGIDTRVLMASLGEGQRLPSYTFGGTWGETFDIRKARRISRMCGWDHRAIRLDESFFKEFPSLAEKSVYLSDGMHDALGGHDVFFNREARRIAPVRLTGKFGSEVVRVRKMIPTLDFPSDLLQPELLELFRSLPPASAVNKREHPLSRVLFEGIPWYEYGRVAVEQSQVSLRSPYMDNQLAALMYRAPRGSRKAGGLQGRFIQERSPALASLGTNLGSVDGHSSAVAKLRYLPFWALFKLEYIYLYETPHWVAFVDSKLRRFKPERLLSGRQKFEGYRLWLAGELADFVRETLLASTATTTFFQSKAVTRRVEQHLGGTHNYLAEIDKLLTIELASKSLFRPS